VGHTHFVAGEDYTVTTDQLSTVSPRLRRLVVGMALLFAVMYLATALPRVYYPYDLDFIEDGLLMTAWRVAEGQPVYVAPNADFVPHVYMPLYTWLGGLLFRFTGPGFVPLRLLSLAATLGSATLLFAIARRISGFTWLGLVSAGLFLGGYRISGFWYELARVDSLFVFLLLAGLWLATARGGGVSGRGGTGARRRRLLLAAVLLALALFTKQTGLIVAVAVAIYLLWIARWRAGWFIAPFGLLVGGGLLWMQLRSEGWFAYYVVTVAGVNPLAVGRVVRYIGVELLGFMAGLSVMAVLAAWLYGRQRRFEPWLLWIVVAALVSGLGRASVGGNLNNLMPVYALLCLAPALLVDGWRVQPGFLPRWRGLLLAGLLVAQFGLGAYNPLRYIPTQAMRYSGHLLTTIISVPEGEVLVMMHPYYATLAGKRPSAQIAAMWHARRRGLDPLPPDFVARLEGQYYDAIVSDESLFETEPALRRLLAENYQMAEQLSGSASPPTISGMVVRPQLVYVRRDADNE
jgi:hypothetical protein